MDEPVLFHLAGVRLGDGLAKLDPSLRPALFARFGDLPRLRYDFPLVLVERPADGPRVLPLSRIVDDLLRAVAQKGIAGERLRRSVLRVERGVRALTAGGARGTLADLWSAAAEPVVAAGGSGVAADLSLARAALRIDGSLIDCDQRAPFAVVRHAWRTVADRRIDALRGRIDRLIARLMDLVTADLLRSEEGRRAGRLRASVGPAHRDLFDFDLMAHLLAKPSGHPALPARRRRRIEETLVTLRRADALLTELAGDLVFDRIEAALAAAERRRPAVAALARAIAVAELEADGSYVDATHDEQVRRPDEDWLRPDVLALFPDPLVRIGARHEAAGPALRAQLLEGLTSGMPLKILFETDDALGVDASFATSAMGLGDVFVVQTPSAHLFHMAPKVAAAAAHPGPSLISIFTGVVDRGAVPAYLFSAAALTARAFPAFSYDPAAGAEWRDRFALDRGPQPDRTWPRYPLAYADASLRRRTEEVAFTAADLALCDPRRSAHFAAIVGDAWRDAVVPVADGLDEDARATGRAPYVRAIDSDGRLRDVLIDQRLLTATRRAADAWHRLLELDGLKEERAARTVADTPRTSGPPGAQTEARSDEVGTEERDADTPYIDTTRCSTCNECTLLNPRMFAYDQNKQAYIKDLSAGTYRELVEAAENCQVAIIHPGKPRDPNEPGLEELMRRAEAFR